jgi:hypothetical protein
MVPESVITNFIGYCQSYIDRRPARLMHYQDQLHDEEYDTRLVGYAFILFEVRGMKKVALVNLLHRPLKVSFPEWDFKEER